MVDIEVVKKLIEMMVANDLMEISLRDGAEEVNLKRPGRDAVPNLAMPMHGPNLQASIAPAAGETPGDASPPPRTEVEEDLVAICSPMVGTFYASPSPGAQPFVGVGSSVSPDTVVCIVEAMKVFNEIKAEIRGTIAKLMVNDQDPIEYGQVLFLVRSPA